MTDYDEARTKLREAELLLMQQRESVATMRREMPPGPIVDDYVFGSGDGDVRLSELFTDPARPLVLYHFMVGKQQTEACPMCSMWVDGWNAVARHLERNLDLALVTAAPVAETEALADQRGWSNLRWLSGADNSFKLDIGGEDEAGNQWPFISAYRLDDGVPRLTYSGGAHIDGEHWRGLDLLSPVWHFLDLTTAGRGDWMPGLDYE